MSGRFNSTLRTGMIGRRGLRRQEKTEDGRGFKFVDAGTEEFTYEVSIDWNHVTGEMVRDAAANKSGQSHAGPVQVRIISRRQV